MGTRLKAGTRALAVVAGALAVALVAAIVVLEIGTRNGVTRAEEAFAADVPDRITDFGTTKTLSILPLIDWHTSDPNLQTEMGVSYLSIESLQAKVFSHR